MMDPLDWLIGFGNINATIYLQKTLGIGYALIKLVMWLIILGIPIYLLIQYYRHNYAVNIWRVGPEKTISAGRDRGRINKKTSEFKLWRRKITIPQTPNEKHIAPSFRLKWTSGVINLYQYGVSEYSFTPINFELTKRGEKGEKYDVKFIPVEPKLGLIQNAVESTMRTLDKRSMLERLAPLAAQLLPFLIFSILLLIVAQKFMGAASSLAESSQMIAKAMESFARCAPASPPI